MNKLTIWLVYLLFGVILIHRSSSAVFKYEVKLKSIDSNDDQAQGNKFIRIGKKYYWIDTINKMNWLTAHHVCRRNFGQLATIQSEDEMKVLNSYLHDHKLNALRFWIAGNDLTEENHFQWISNGQPINYAKWGPGQPDNARNTEHCVELRTYSNEFLMNDVNCDIEFNVICELDISCVTKKSVKSKE